jgi:hypothetical protein
MIEQYKNVLSPSKADTCRMHPACSEYARQAYERYPFWKATLIATDRLNRSDHDSGRYEIVEIGGRKKQYDPLPGTPCEPSVASPCSATAPIHPVDVLLAGKKPDLSDEETALDFARYLHALGKTEAALTEYLRFLRQYPESALASSVRMSVMYLYYDTRDYRETILWAEQQVSEGKISDNDLPELRFWLSAAYARLNNPQRARAALPPAPLDPHLSARSKLIEGYTYAQQENWPAAVAIFQEYGDLADDQAKAETLTASCQNAMSRKRKSPAMAGLLGVVPGLGYLYAGYPGSALSALVLDSLLLVASYKAFDDGNEALGALLGIVGVGWYTGSIYGSVSAAERRNENDLRETLIQLNLGFRF